MNSIELLDKAIELYAGGSQKRFVEFSHIKDSTMKTWRNRKSIPDDKKLLLNTLIEKYDLIQENKKYQEYFRLQNELGKKFQN